MALITWVGGFSDNFGDQQNWNPAQVPGSADDAVIDTAVATTIAVVGPVTVNSVTTSANVTLSVTSGSLTLEDNVTANDPAGTSTNAGTIAVAAGANLILPGSPGAGTGIIDNAGGVIQATGSAAAAFLENGTIEGGTLESSAGGDIFATNGYHSSELDGATAAGAVTNTGTVDLADNADLLLAGTITNHGTILLGGTYFGAELILTGPTVTLSGGGEILMNGTAASLSHIVGNTGTETLLNVNDTIEGSGTIASLTLVNQATIDANGTTAIVITASGTNTGLMEATNLGGLALESLIDNAGGAILATGTGDNVSLASATVQGGTLQTSNGGAIVAADGSTSTLDGATVGALKNTGLFEIADDATVDLLGIITNSGTIATEGTYFGSTLVLAGATVTLAGAGLVSLLDNLPSREVITGGTSTDVLVNVNDTIEGAGSIVGMTLVNQATIDADATHALVIGAGGTNTGLLEATGTGGLVLASTIDDAHGTILANGTGVAVYLEGADIQGGTLETQASGDILVAGGFAATLDGSTAAGIVTNTGAFQVSDDSTLDLLGTIHNSGTIATVGTYFGSTLVLAGATVTLAGAGVVSLLDNLPGRELIIGGASTDVLVNVNDTIAGAGSIENLVLTNQATIDASGTNALVVSASGTNTKLMEATNTGGLVLTGVIDNAGGTILASGAGDNVYLENGTIESGTLQSGSGGEIVAVTGFATSELDGATAGQIVNAGTVLVADNAHLLLAGTIDNTGTIATDGTYFGSTLVLASTTVTLTGAGVVSLLDNLPVREVIIGSTGTDVLVNVNDTIVGAGSIENLVLANEGTIDASGTNALVVSASGTNTKLMEATNIGGLVLTGVIDNAGGTILASGAGNDVYLQNGTIESGTLQSGSGGEIVAVTGFATSELDGATAGQIVNAGTVLVADDAELLLAGTIDNTGTIATDGTFYGSTLVLAGATVTLAGGGVVSLLDNLPSREVITGGSGTDVLVNVSDTIEGAGSIENLVLTNEATIDASGADALVISASGTNTKLMEATNTGGLVLTGVVGNAGGTILASGAGDSVYLENSTIEGGTLQSSGGGEIVAANGYETSELDGSTAGQIVNAGTVLVADDAHLLLAGTIDNTGTIATDGTYFGSTLVLASTTVTLTGAGVVSLLDNLPVREVITGGTSTDVLVNVNDTIVGAGSIENLAFFDNQGTVDGSGVNALVIGLGTGTLTNTGLFESSNSGGLTVSGGTLTNLNAGTLTGGAWEATVGAGVGTLALDPANTGTITTDAADIIFSGTAGVIEVNNGSTYVALQNSLATIAAGGTLALENGYDYATAITLADSGVIDLVAGTFSAGTVDVLAGGAVSGTGTVAAVVSNLGSIAAAAGGTLVLAGGVTGAGALVANGTLEFAAAGNVINGPILGSGVLDFGAGSASSINLGVSGNIGTVEIDAGAALTMGLGAKYGGTLNDIAVTGTSTFNLGGHLLNFTRASFFEGESDGEALVDGGGTLEGSSLMTLGGAVLDGGTELLNTATVDQTGALGLGDGAGGIASAVNGAGAKYLLEGDVGIAAAAPASDVFHNSGLFEKAAGTGLSTIASGFANAGTIDVASGTLDLTGGIVNTGLINVAAGVFETTGTISSGTLSVAAGALANLSAAGAHETAQGVTLATGGSLDLGTGTLTVTGDYLNRGTGTGNSYSPDAGVTGTINGKGAMLAVVGVNGTEITTVNGTLTITLTPNGANRDSGEFEIENTGAAGGATLRGALQTSVNGGSITNPGLSGNGVVAANFSPLAAGGASGIFTINYNTTDGALTGQSIHIASDFANVPGLTLALATNPPASPALFNQYAAAINPTTSGSLSVTPPPTETTALLATPRA